MCRIPLERSIQQGACFGDLLHPPASLGVFHQKVDVVLVWGGALVVLAVGLGGIIGRAPG